MVSTLLLSLVQRSTTVSHLHQIQAFLIKTGLDQYPPTISFFISNSLPISLDFTHSLLTHIPIPAPLFYYNTLIRHHANTLPIKSLNLFFKLREIGIKPDKFTYPFVIKACGRSLLSREGRGVHCLVVKQGFHEDHYVGNTLLSMYGLCGEIGFSKLVFDEMPVRDVVSWSSLIAAYVACNCQIEAVAAFQQMNLNSVKPNSVTLISLLCACTHLRSLSMGKSIHKYLTVCDMELDTPLGTALLEMYYKCGAIENAIILFSSMRRKNLQTWTAMICGLASHGRGIDAISLFEQMENDGVKPDGVSFSAILSACSHLGLINEGRNYFHRMVNIYKITASMEHYGCMVDLYGRAGMVEEAYKIIRNMPRDPNSIILRSFMSACRLHGKVLTLDNHLTKLLLEAEPNLGANYVLAANVSAISGQQGDEANVRASMKKMGLKKVPGCSYVM